MGSEAAVGDPHDRVFIGIGANEGNRYYAIAEAVKRLGMVNGVWVLQMAPIIETEPVGGPPQGQFLNTVIAIRTTLDPHSLLGVLQDIERHLGRPPVRERWGPRVIDLDLLLYNDVMLHDAALSLPHPRMHERRFVLEPLAYLAPELIHPTLGQSIATLAAQVAHAPPC